MVLVIISTITLVGLWTFPTTEASPFVISDYRIRSLDVTPTLGRGYSIMTNTFQSGCLTVDETTTPSYNYDCKFATVYSTSFITFISVSNNPTFPNPLLFA